MNSHMPSGTGPSAHLDLLHPFRRHFVQAPLLITLDDGLERTNPEAGAIDHRAEAELRRFVGDSSHDQVESGPMAFVAFVHGTGVGRFIDVTMDISDPTPTRRKSWHVVFDRDRIRLAAPAGA